MGPAPSVPLDIAMMIGSGLVSGTGLYWALKGRISRNEGRIKELEVKVSSGPTTGGLRAAIKEAEEAHGSATAAHRRLDEEEKERQKLALEQRETATIVKGLTASIDGRLASIDKGLEEMRKLLVEHITKGAA